MNVTTSRARGVEGDHCSIVPKIEVVDFSVQFGGKSALRKISLPIYPKQRLAIIGPAGSGKTTLLRSLNRLNDLDAGFVKEGQILLDGKDIFDGDVDVPTLRRHVGMVYAVPIPLPWTIYDNIAFGPRMAGLPKPPKRSKNQTSAKETFEPVSRKSQLDEVVETSLRRAMLWDEVKDRLDELGTNLSGGQQQRLCLARVLALEPEVLLLDEPCSGLDPISTSKIEEALDELKSRYSIVLVTNNTKQAARASDRTALLLMGELIEIGSTAQVFTNPHHGRTAEYITGHFG